MSFFTHLYWPAFETLPIISLIVQAADNTAFSCIQLAHAYSQQKFCSEYKNWDGPQPHLYYGPHTFNSVTVAYLIIT